MAEVYKNANSVAAHEKTVVARVHRAGRQIAAKAKALIESEPQHRTGKSQIVYYEGDTDSVIELNDTRDAWAAAAIEYGRKRGRGAPTRGVYVLKKATNGVHVK